MDIASHQIDLEAARLLFSPALIAAAAAVWLTLVSGAAGRMVLQVEEISRRLGTPGQLPESTTTTLTIPVERHQAERRHPTCTRSPQADEPTIAGPGSLDILGDYLSATRRGPGRNSILETNGIVFERRLKAVGRRSIFDRRSNGEGTAATTVHRPEPGRRHSVGGAVTTRS